MMMAPRLRVLAVTLVGGILIISIVAAVLRDGLSGDTPIFALGAVTLLGVSAVLLTRVPANPVSWVLLGVSVALPLMGISEMFSDDSIRDLISGIGIFALLVPGMGVFIPLWFPTGQAPSPKWRWVAWLGGGAVALMFVGLAVIALIERGDTGEVGECSSIGTCSAIGGLIALLVATVSAVVSLVVRWRRATGIERLQLRWLVPAFFVFGLGVLAEFGGFQDSPVALTLLPAGLLLVPIAIGIAITRYRLYEIDRIINRTFVYAVVATVLAGLFAAGVALTTTVLPTGSSDFGVAASTLAVAGLFNPLRRRVQATVDRRFYRTRYDPQQVAEQLSVLLRSQVNPGAVGSHWAEVATRALQPTTIGVWVRGGE